MPINRDEYLNELIAKRNNGQTKVITGVRRCGKSYLLFTLYKDYLIQSGIPESHIIALALDNALNAKFRDPLALSEYLKSKIADDGETHYVFLDEIQFVGRKKLQTNPDIFVSFYDILNELQGLGNVDIYVTGSNSRMLSKDVLTEFRGRGDELRISPLTFAEYFRFAGGGRDEAFADYLRYGGMPALPFLPDEAEKARYLTRLFSETYLKDILERNRVDHPEALGMIADELCSSVGSFTNASKISNTLWSEQGIRIDVDTVGSYLEHLTDSYLFSLARRYDVKGRRYFSYPSKYYCVDPGLRNARLNFRQIEETHLMENVIYNELVARGYRVDVGVVQGVEKALGRNKRFACEIDFVVNAWNSGEKCYIQSALAIDGAAKMEQEIRPFLKLRNDFTKRILVTKTSMKPWVDEHGILHLGIYDFLLDRKLLEG